MVREPRRSELRNRERPLKEFVDPYPGSQRNLRLLFLLYWMTPLIRPETAWLAGRGANGSLAKQIITIRCASPGRRKKNNYEFRSRDSLRSKSWRSSVCANPDLLLRSGATNL